MASASAPSAWAVTVVVWQPDPQYEPPPPELCELLDLVLADLQGSEPIAVQIGWDPTMVLGARGVRRVHHARATRIPLWRS